MSSVPRWQSTDNPFDWFPTLGVATSLPWTQRPSKGPVDEEGFQWGKIWSEWFLSQRSCPSQLCECWDDECVVFGEGVSFKVSKTQYVVSLLNAEHVQISLWQDLPTRMRGSKVQCVWFKCSTVNDPCQWKGQNQLITSPALKYIIGLLLFVSHRVSVSYHESCFFYPFPLTLHDDWLLSSQFLIARMLELAVKVLKTENKSLIFSTTRSLLIHRDFELNAWACLFY